MDSCLQVLKTSKEDTNKVILLDKIAWDIAYTNLQKGLDYSIESMDLAQKLNYKTKLAKICNTQGAIYADMAQHAKAFHIYLDGLRYAKLYKLYKTEGTLYNNIGELILKNKEYRKALSYFFLSNEATKKGGLDPESSVAFSNISSIYNQFKNYDSALYFLNANLNYNIKNKRLDKLIDSYVKLSQICYSQGNKSKALSSANEAVNIATKLKDNYSLAQAQMALSNAYYLDNNIAMAITTMIDATITATIVGDITTLESCFLSLSNLYEEIGDFKNSLKYFKEYELCKQKIFNNESTQLMKNAEAKFDNERKQDEIILLSEKQKLNETENRQKKMYLYLSSFGIVILISGLLFLYRNNVLKQKINLTLAANNTEIKHQKELLESKNKEITDSINYAKRIQQSILTSDNYFKKHTTDYFILFKPKDIVSGDFYWALNHENKFILMTADCTGHGVPGAMMSMMGINFLNEIVTDKKMSSPANILNQLRSDIIKALNQEGSLVETKDGLDCSLCSFDFAEMKLIYTNANNKLYILRDNELIISESNKMPIGAGHNSEELFQEWQIDLQKNDIIITLTDGYADQFGGPKGKKYKYFQLEKLLLSSAHLPLSEIKNKLNDSLISWKGNLEQVDDICIVAIKI